MNRPAPKLETYNLVIVCTKTKVVLLIDAHEELKLSLGGNTRRDGQQTNDRHQHLPIFKNNNKNKKNKEKKKKFRSFFFINKKLTVCLKAETMSVDEEETFLIPTQPHTKQQQSNDDDSSTSTSTTSRPQQPSTDDVEDDGAPYAAPTQTEHAKFRATTLLRALTHGKEARIASLRNKSRRAREESEHKLAKFGLLPTHVAAIAAAVDAADASAESVLVGAASVPMPVAKVVASRERRAARLDADAALCADVDVVAWHERVVATGRREFEPLSPGERSVALIATVNAALVSYEKWRRHEAGFAPIISANRKRSLEIRGKPLPQAKPKAKDGAEKGKKKKHVPLLRRDRLRLAKEEKAEKKRNAPPVYANKPQSTRANVKATKGYAQSVKISSLFLESLSGEKPERQKRAAPSDAPPLEQQRAAKQRPVDGKSFARPWDRQVDTSVKPKKTVF
jgi:hypothetical protein